MTKNLFLTCLLAAVALLASAPTAQTSVRAASTDAPWRFAVFGDSRTAESDPVILREIAAAIAADGVDLVLFPGDLVGGGTSGKMHSELINWRTAMAPLYRRKIGVYPIRGNHDVTDQESATIWRSVFSGRYALPRNGPGGEAGLTYSFAHKNALFVGLDEYISGRGHRVNEAWVAKQLAANKRPHIFAFGHEPAFKEYHADCLGSYPTERNTFWRKFTDAGGEAYFCGHDHFFDVARIDGGGSSGGAYQCIVGTAGAPIYPERDYDGDNAPYTPVRLYHSGHYGYLLVEVSGSGASDVGITMTWKERTYDPRTSSYKYRATSDVVRFEARPSLKGA